MKPLILLAIAALAPTLLPAQTIVDSGLFFDPNTRLRRDGATSGVLAVSVTNDPVTSTASSGDVSWNHSVGGFVQARSELLGLPPLTPVLANLDVQLAAFSQTINDTLVFGREFTSDAEILGIVDAGPALQGLVNQVAGASVIYNWQSDATVTGLAIVPDQLYQVNFTVSSGGGLPVDLLQSAGFGITTAGVTGASNESAGLLNLLDILAVGDDPSTGNFSFVFKSNQNLSSLDFTFNASTVAGVNLFGGTAQNQNVLTFSGFQVTTVPEPSSLMLSGLFIGIITLRRKRNRE